MPGLYQWNKKPSVGMKINKGLSIVKGMQGFYPINEIAGKLLIDYLQNINLNIDSASKFSNNYLVNSGKPAGASNLFPDYYKSISTITFVISVKIDSLTSSDDNIVGIHYDYLNDSPFWTTWLAVSTADQLSYGYNSSGGWYFVRSAYLVDTSKDIVFGVEYSPEGFKLYINGDLYTTDSTAWVPAFSSTSRLAIGDSNTGAVEGVSVYWMGWWDRALTAAEHKSISFNKDAVWSILNPQIPTAHYLTQRQAPAPLRATAIYFSDYLSNAFFDSDYSDITILTPSQNIVNLSAAYFSDFLSDSYFNSNYSDIRLSPSSSAILKSILSNFDITSTLGNQVVDLRQFSSSLFEQTDLSAVGISSRKVNSTFDVVTTLSNTIIRESLITNNLNVFADINNKSINYSSRNINFDTSSTLTDLAIRNSLIISTFDVATSLNSSVIDYKKFTSTISEQTDFTQTVIMASNRNINIEVRTDLGLSVNRASYIHVAINENTDFNTTYIVNSPTSAVYEGFDISVVLGVSPGIISPTRATLVEQTDLGNQSILRSSRGINFIENTDLSDRFISAASRSIGLATDVNLNSNVIRSIYEYINISEQTDLYSTVISITPSVSINAVFDSNVTLSSRLVRLFDTIYAGVVDTNVNIQSVRSFDTILSLSEQSDIVITTGRLYQEKISFGVVVDVVDSVVKNIPLLENIITDGDFNVLLVKKGYLSSGVIVDADLSGLIYRAMPVNIKTDVESDLSVNAGRYSVAQPIFSAVVDLELNPGQVSSAYITLDSAGTLTVQPDVVGAIVPIEVLEFVLYAVNKLNFDL